MANEEQLQLCLQLPIRAVCSCANVVEELRSRIQWLMADLEESAYAAADGHSPAIVPLRVPIRGVYRGRHEIPPALEVIKGEPVDGHLILMYVVDPCEFIAN